MKRRSFLKAVGAAAVGVTPAWSVPHLADQQAPNFFRCPKSTRASLARKDTAERLPAKIPLQDSHYRSSQGEISNH
jgi:hypothetical protein